MRPSEQLLEAASTLPGKVTAYHCGRPLKGGRFSLSTAGSGEGLSALGPGIYFATEPHIARLYCKYVRNPIFYTVKIDTRGIYDAVWGVPKKLREPVQKLAAKIAAEKGLKELPMGRRLTHGPGHIGAVFRALGSASGLKALRGAGVTGAYEKLPVGGFEIAVYDPAIVTMVDQALPAEVKA
jgi:hypothetical protein